MAAANIGIAASGAGHLNFDSLHRCTVVPADEFQFGFLLLSSTLYFQLGSGSGLDILKFPTCTNICPLYCMHFKTVLIMKVTREILTYIADSLDCGFRCFIHKKNHEVVTFMDEDEFSDSDAWEEDKDKVFRDRDNYIEVEKMEPSSGFEIMKAFLDFVDDNNTKDRLLQALEGRKPFANFKIQLDNSDKYREKWFAYKRERMIDWVKRQLENELD